MTPRPAALCGLLLWTAAGTAAGAHGSDLPAAATAPDAATQWVMGTVLTIDIPGAGVSPESAAARAAAFAEAVRWDGLISHWLPDSPLSQLNAYAGRGPVEVAPELFAYLTRAVRDSDRTGGLFDITVGALLAHHRSDSMDPPDEALARTGSKRIGLAAPNLVTLPIGISLDPGGDGKGVALDAMVAILRSEGIKNAFLDFGGSSFYGLGVARDGLPWRVALEGTDGRIVGYVRLRDASLSASASLRTLEDGSAVPHIVDPRDGRLVESPRAAFAISASATDAEVLSTALIVSPGDGSLLRERFPGSELAVLPEGPPRWVSSGFPWEAVDEDSLKSP